jgi:hypothetical protein
MAPGPGMSAAANGVTTARPSATTMNNIPLGFSTSHQGEPGLFGMGVGSLAFSNGAQAWIQRI